jgi:zinc/manganese transport system substrate-binding protein
MKKALMFLLAALMMPSAHAALNVFACEPEWDALTHELAGDRVETYVAATALQDVHHIQARPSLIAKLRRADLLVCSGADLEAGWLPALLRQAGNAKVQPGQNGYFEAAMQVERLEIPAQLDRAQGDLHAAGSPHVHLDPRRVLIIARALSARLAELDAAGASEYSERLKQFTGRWQQAIARWEQQAAPLKGATAVSHHKDWVYLYNWLGMEEAATLEPKPGLPSSAGHLAALKAQMKDRPARLIVRAAYQDERPSRWLAEQTGIPAVMLPYTVGGTPEARDLYTLFDDTLQRLLKAVK